MPLNETTEFVCDLKFGDRIRKITVRGRSIHDENGAKAHIKKLQDKGLMSKGDVVAVKERPRDNAKRPEVMQNATENGVSLNTGGGAADVI